MSKTADCPICKMHNCVSDFTELNYCAWCGYSFKDNKNPQEIKIDKITGQVKLF